MKLGSKHIEILLKGGLSKQRLIDKGYIGKFSLVKPVSKGDGSHNFQTVFVFGLVPFSRTLNTTLFILFYILLSSSQLLMRINHHLQRKKLEGFIVRKSEQKYQQEQPRTLSLERPLPSHTTIVSNEQQKIPGQIKKGMLNRSRKVDEEVYYNADVYTSRVKKEESVAYTEECENILPVIREKREVQVTPVTNNSRINSSLQSIQEERLVNRITNIHGSFDLQKYHQLYSTLKSLITSINSGPLQLAQTLERYIIQIGTSNIDDFSEMKLVYTKKQLLRQTFIRQREGIMIMCLVVSLGKVDKMKKYCSNMVKYIFENYLVALNLLAENGEFVSKLMIQQGKEHLLDKKFQFLRSTNEVLNDFIAKIIKVDPLYAEQFYKIRQQYSNASVKSFMFGHLSFFAFYLHAIKAETILPFLALPPSPYLQEASQKQYTLVIDFIKVFLDISSLKKKSYRQTIAKIRPFSSYFLSQMSKYYQIVSFSDAMPIQCSRLINRIDEYQVVKSKLYRYHIDRTHKKKEIKRIGRDLDKLIMIDTVEDQGNKNLVLVDSWKGDQSNAQLAQICPLLAMIAVKQVPARQAVKKIRQNIQTNNHLGLKYINCGIAL